MSSTAEDDGPFTPAVPDADPVAVLTPREWASAAIGALNRRDVRVAITAVQHALRDHDSTMAAVDLLSGILLSGFPHGGLRRGARITLDVTAAPDDARGRRAVRLATDLITAIASDDGDMAAPVLHALRGPKGLDILLVLVRAAAARVDGFVGVDGDTVDAYYAAVREHARQG